MKIVGMMAVRNEAHEIGLSLRVALMWCDAVVVLDHASTDRTSAIVGEVMCKEEPGRVLYIGDGSPSWDEMRHRNRMLGMARSIGGTHFAIIDADEILTGNLLQPFSDTTVKPITAYFASLQPSGILQLPGYNLRNGIGQYHSNGVWGKRLFSVGFMDPQERLTWPERETFHHREPSGAALCPYTPCPQGAGGVMHLWGASERRLIAKHALYKVIERLKWTEKNVKSIESEYTLWRPTPPSEDRGDWIKWPSTWWPASPANWTFSAVPESWWAPYEDLMKYLDVNEEPWQEAECRRLVAEHGREKFTGLDLFGVA